MAIWAFHGDRDTVVPPHASRVMIKALRDAGAKPRYDELENVGHLCWDRAYATEELWDWLFAQKRGEKPAPAPAR